MAYNKLVAGTGWLKSVVLKPSPIVGATHGVSLMDLTAAQTMAVVRVNAELSSIYDVKDWLANPPPVIAHIAELLSAAEVLDYKYQRGDTVDGEDTNLPMRLRARAERLLARLRGEGPPLEVVLSAGMVQRQK